MELTLYFAPVECMIEHGGRRVTDAGSIFVGGGGEGYAMPQTPSAQVWQPPRPDRGRHRHRQDGHASDPGRRLFGRGRSGLPGRRQGRSRRPGDARLGRRTSATKLSSSARPPSGSICNTAAFPSSFWDLFGQQGHPIRDHGGRDGAAAAVAPDGADRAAGRRAERRLPRCGRGGPAASRPQGPPGAARLRRRERQARSGCATATSRPPRSARSSAGCWCSKTRAARSSSANRRSIWPT